MQVLYFLTKSFALTGVLITTILCHSIMAQEIQPDRTLVLHNGGILQGKITKEYNYFKVLIDDSSELRIEANQVEFLCDSPSHGYRLKLEKLDPENKSAQLRLAHWCLKHSLIREAELQLKHIYSIGRVDAATMRLAQSIQSQKELGGDKLSSRSGPHKSKDPYGDPYGEPARSKQSYADRFDFAATPDLPQISQATLRSFVKDVQPRLLNACKSCHQLGSDRLFNLAFDASGRTPKNLTERNLAVIMQFVDREEPENSKFLEYFTSSHGGQDTPTFRKGSKHHIALLRWLHSTDISNSNSNSNPVKLASFTDRKKNLNGGWVAVPVDHQANRGVDPFDPAIFNRKYGEQKEAAADKASSTHQTKTHQTKKTATATEPNIIRRPRKLTGLDRLTENDPFDSKAVAPNGK